MSLIEELQHIFNDLKSLFEPPKPPNITWAFRVIKDQQGYRIADVMSKDGVPDSRTAIGAVLYDNYSDLQESVETYTASLLNAFHQPTLAGDLHIVDKPERDKSEWADWGTDEPISDH
jgi:hypothetical protein